MSYRYELKFAYKAVDSCSLLINTKRRVEHNLESIISINLNFDGPLGGEHALGVVVGRPELDALFGDLGKLQQADHL